MAGRAADGGAPNIVSVEPRGLMTKLSAEAYAIVEGRHSDPFHYLGLHSEGKRTVVRAFLPEASKVEAIDEHGGTATLVRIHKAGLFAGALPNGPRRYQLRARFGDTVVGDFNFWNARRHPMRVRGVGYWELFVPHATAGDRYKFDIIGPQGQHLPLKADPLAFAAEMRPSNASIVFDEARLPQPRPAPANVNALNAPMSIYEVHLGSWRRKQNNEWLTYRDLAEQLPRYISE